MTNREYFELVLLKPVAKLAIEKYKRFAVRDGHDIDREYRPSPWKDSFYLKDNYDDREISMLKQQRDCPCGDIFILGSGIPAIPGMFPSEKYIFDLPTVRRGIETAEVAAWSKYMTNVCHCQIHARKELREKCYQIFGLYYIGDYRIDGIDVDRYNMLHRLMYDHK